MTDRLYYDDPYTRVFDATVLRAEARGGGMAVWLDRTAFYPTSGGQPFDVGTLDGHRVVLVEEDAAGDIVHLLEGQSGPEAGATVDGQIDWVRRFDHMQQHTGQHVLSAVIEHAFGARTVGFHLGADASTIDLAGELTSLQIARAEHDANAVIWEDRQVAIRFASDEEARSLPLRKESDRTGTLRLIDIDGIDLSACGGTHVSRTGAVGQIAVARWERFKGGQRIEFLCGGRALSRCQLLRDATAAAVRLVSVLPSELPSAIERLQGELKEQKRTIAALQAELAMHQADTLAARAEAFPRARVVLAVLDTDAPGLKVVASAVASRPGFAAVVVSRTAPALVVAARAPDVDVECHDLIAALTKAYGGRGGGKPDLAQCGGLQGSPDAILETARAILRMRE